MLTTDEIDRELDSRTRELNAASANLLELDNHPGLQHVRRYPPIGATAQRWAVVQKSLDALWQDVGRMTSILDSAKAVRARRSRLDEDDRVELTRWLRERPLEVSRERIPLAQRTVTGPGEAVGYVGLADMAQDMQLAYPAVAEFLDDVDRINALIVDRLAPLQQRLDDAGAAFPAEIAELLAVSATDPLSLTAHDVEARILVIAATVERRSAELAELAALRANWPDALAVTSTRLDALRQGVDRVAEARARVERDVVSSPLPVHEDEEPGLRAEFGALTATDPAALRSLRVRIEAALRVVAEDEELAQGLLDRRIELKGRLTAYQAKAARLDLGEDRDLLASSRIASGLLHRQPCDLRAVTRAVADYQQLLVEKQGSVT
jgi:putative ubiquitin-RnfH superfamily antitoxin RatB of RatAB toxin-antitoxin module